MELSKRLQAVADMISEDMVVADLGTDHAYIPIHLIQSGKCQKVYAMDINEGPYLKAKEHVAAHGLSDNIITRISNGMKALNSGEANAIVIAGMGGGLVMKILEQDRRLWPELDEFILQPQSEIHKVRAFLWDNDFTIIEENMIHEEGKYYPMMKVVKRKILDDKKLCVELDKQVQMKANKIQSESPKIPYGEAELFYGPELIAQKHPVLLEFINKEIQVKEEVLGKLNEQVEKTVPIDEEKIKALQTRIEVLNKELELAYEVQRIM